MQRGSGWYIFFVLFAQIIINYACILIFPNNFLVATIVSDALIAMLFAFIILPPEYKRTFYKQEIFHRTAITYFIIFIAISLIFGVFI